MRRLFWIISGVVIVCFGLVLAAPLLIPTQTLRTTIVNQIENNTGYDVRIDGDVSFSLVPSVRLVANDVGVSVPGSPGPEFITARETRFGLGLAGLLSGSAQVNEIALVEPRIHLQTDPFGTNNYTVASHSDGASSAQPSRFDSVPTQAPAGQSLQPAPTVSPSTQEQSGEGAPGEADLLGGLSDVGVASLRVEDATIIIEDLLAGTRNDVSDITIAARMPSLDETFDLTATAMLNGEPVEISSQVERPRSLLEAGQTMMSLVLRADAYLTDTLRLTAAPSRQNDVISISDASIELGDNKIQGNARVDLSAAKPIVTADVSGPFVDVDALMTQEAIRTFNSAPVNGEHEEAALIAGDAAQFAQVAGTEVAVTDPEIDFSVLTAFDLALTYSIDAVRLSGLDLKPLVGSANVQAGVLDASIDLLGVAGGDVAARTTVNAAGAEPQIEGAVRGSNISLSAFSQLIPVDQIQGTAALDLSFVTAGRTQSELLQRFNAAGEASVSDGIALGIGMQDQMSDPLADRVEDVNVRVSAASLDQPIALDGGLVWRREPIRLNGSLVATPFLNGDTQTPMPVAFNMSSGRVTAGYNGSLTAKGDMSGKVSVETNSLRALLAWLEQPIDIGSGLERFAYNGELDLSAERIRFSNSTIMLDNSQGQGEGEIVLSDVPVVRATLNMDQLDMTPYLFGAGSNSGADGAASAGSSGSGAATPSNPAAPSSRGSTAGWSSEPIDFSGLSLVKADLNLTTQSLIADKIRTGPVAVTVAVDSGKAEVDLTNLQLYGGSGSGKVTIDAQSADANGTVSPAIASVFNLDGLDARPFLTDAADFGRIAGRGSIDLNVTARGNSEAALVSALNGSAGFSFRDGAIIGINIPKLMRSLSSGVLFGWQDQPDETTDFAELASSFQITNGVAQTSDLRMIGPFVRMTGQGSANMPNQTLDFVVDPQVVASLEGQGANGEFQGLGVPVNIRGPWSNPQIFPDIQGILQNPQAAYEQLRSLGGGLFKNLPEQIGNGATGGIGGLIEQNTGISLDGVVEEDGNINERVLREQAGDAIRNLLGGGQTQETQTAPAAQPQQADQQAQPAQEQQSADQQQQLEDAANQLLRGIFGQ